MKISGLGASYEEVAELASQLFIEEAKASGCTTIIPDGPTYGADDVRRIFEAAFAAIAGGEHAVRDLLSE